MEFFSSQYSACLCACTHTFLCVFLWHKVDLEQLSEPGWGEVTNSYSMSCLAVFDCHGLQLPSKQEGRFISGHFGSYCLSSKEDWLRWESQKTSVECGGGPVKEAREGGLKRNETEPTTYEWNDCSYILCEKHYFQQMGGQSGGEEKPQGCRRRVIYRTVTGLGQGHRTENGKEEVRSGIRVRKTRLAMR